MSSNKTEDIGKLCISLGEVTLVMGLPGQNGGNESVVVNQSIHSLMPGMNLEIIRMSEREESPEMSTSSNLSDHDSGTEQSRDYVGNSRFNAVENFGSEGQLISFDMDEEQDEDVKGKKSPLLELMTRKIKALEAEKSQLKEAQLKVVILQKQKEKLLVENTELKTQLNHARSVISTLKDGGGHSTDGDVQLNSSANSDAPTVPSPVARDEIETPADSQIEDSTQLVLPTDDPPQEIVIKRKRGRPPKQPSNGVKEVPTSSDMVKGRGRQPKSESERGSSVRTPKSPRTPLRPSFETLSPTSSEGPSVFYIQKRGRGRPPKNSPVFAVAKNKVASSSVRARRNTISVAKKKQDSPESPVLRRQGRQPARKRSNSSDSFATAAKIPRFSKHFDDESTDCDSDEDKSSSAEDSEMEYIPPEMDYSEDTEDSDYDTDEVNTMTSHGESFKRLLPKEWQLQIYCLTKSLDEESIKLMDQLVADESVNVNCSVGHTLCFSPLLLLCRQCNGSNLYSCLKILLRRKDLDLTVKNNFGHNAFNLLCRRYDNPRLLECLELLVESGVQVDVSDKKARNALTLLPRYYNQSNLNIVLKFVLQQGLNIQSRDAKGNNSLMVACTHYNQNSLIHTVKLLLKNKISLSVKNENGNDAMTLLCENYTGRNLKEIIGVMVNEPSLDNKSKYAYNALLTLSSKQRHRTDLPAIVRFLVEDVIDSFEPDKKIVIHYLRSVIGNLDSCSVVGEQCTNYLNRYITDCLSCSLS